MRSPRTAVVAALTLALTAATAPATASADYTPTGPIVADSGFRPAVHGYAFPNYANDGEKNLSARQMVKLFGREVCENEQAVGERCKLHAIARGWMVATNRSMAGGHCMGFAVTSELFHAGLGEPPHPSLLGHPIDSAFSLPSDNRTQRHIAYGWALQTLPSVQARSDQVDARRLIDRLREILTRKDEVYTLGIFKQDRSGGHAITPFAIEDRGDGRYGVLVYDNNYPGETRAMDFDVRANTWSYQASPNPKLQAGVYDGTAKVSNLHLMPTTPGLGEQDCFFCRSAASTRKPKLTLLWSGDPDTHEHGNLVISDRRGRRTGCGNFGDGFTCRNQIPGAEFESLLFGGEEVWLQSAQPAYRLPYGRAYEIALSGGDLRKPAREGFALVGKNRFAGVAGVRLRAGERDTLFVSRGARTVIFENDPHQVETPRLQLGVDTKGASFLFQLRARRVKQGAAVGFRLHPRKRRVTILGEDVKGTGRYAVKVVRTSAKGRTVAKRRVVVRSGQTVQVHYGELLRERGGRRG
jgi:hypothetical protein